ADREAWYGDPAAGDVPLAGLLDAGYAAARRALVGPGASPRRRPGGPAAREPRAAGAGPRAGGGGGEPALGPGDTCHLDVIDQEGNIVAATPSGGWLQGSPAIPDLGFCLGTRGQMFWLEEGRPGRARPGGAAPPPR